MKICNVFVENFGGIRLVETPIAEGLTVLNGNNGSGKSSLIHAIQALTNGKDGMPEAPIHDGADKATARAVLSNGYTIEVSQTAGGTFALKLKTPEGALMPSPVAALEKLRGAAGVDPLQIAFESDQKRLRAKLLEAVGVDVSAFDAEEAKLAEDRRVIGRDGETLKGALAKLPAAHPGVERIDVSALAAQSKQRQELDKAERTVESAAEHVQAMVRSASDRRERLAAVTAEFEAAPKPRISDLEAALAEAHRALAEGRAAEGRRLQLQSNMENLFRESAAADRAHADAELALTRASMARDALPNAPAQDEIHAQLGAAAETNAKVEANERRAAMESDLAKARAEYAALTDQITAVRLRRASALSSAGLSVDGLDVSGEQITLFGRPWGAASSGERIRAAVGILLASKAQLRVIWSQEGDKLDDANLGVVRDLCEQNDLQCILERTGIRDEGALILEGGRLVS